MFLQPWRYCLRCSWLQRHLGQSQNAELEAARAELQAGRDQIIREDLQLSEDELSGFWPVYEQYVADLAVVRDRKSVLVGRFLAAYRGGEFSRMSLRSGSSRRILQSRTPGWAYKDPTWSVSKRFCQFSKSLVSTSWKTNWMLRWTHNWRLSYRWWSKRFCVLHALSPEWKIPKSFRL